jgi:hypothetical protein
MKDTVRFDRDGKEVEARLARFLAELTREGITFKVDETESTYDVKLLGY